MYSYSVLREEGETIPTETRVGVQSSSAHSTCQLSYSVKKHPGLSKNNVSNNCILFSPPPPVHEEWRDVVLPRALIFGNYTSCLIIILHLPI